MQLSKHFKLEEMTKSMTATRKGIDNSPGAGDIKNLENVCYEILEPVRAHFDKPITITSGYRSEALCEAIGSKKTSQHAKGQASDFEIFGVSNKELADWIHKNLPYDQLILEFYTPGEPNSGWIHCSWIPDQPRASFLHAYRSEGKTKYKPILGSAKEII